MSSAAFRELPPRSPSPPAQSEGGRGPFAPLLESGENVFLRKRALAPPVAEALEEVAEGDAFDHKAMLDVDALDLSKLLRGVTNPVARTFLAEDMTSILKDFSAAVGRRHLVGQLTVVTYDACCKFHTDHVTVRLLCTYAGPGTEWVKNDDVVRDNLARIDVDAETANRSVLRVEDAVQHCAVGDVLLLKGEAFDGNRGSGAVHRSPPIEGQGLRRLRFKIDEHACRC